MTAKGESAGAAPRQLATTVIGLALLSAALSALILRHGIWAPPDTWGYWEGSVSLLEQGRYTTLDGRPILAWPPLFPLYLAAVQWLFGQTGFALIVAQVGIVFANALVWLSFIQAYRATAATDKARDWPLAASLFVVLFLPLQLVMSLAHAFWLVWIGLATLIGWRIATAPSPAFLRLAAALGSVLALALLTHNTAIIFLPGFALLLATRGDHSWRRRALAVGWMVVLSVGPWHAVRSGLGQLDTHVPTAPPFTAGEYLHQTMIGLGRYFIGSLHYSRLLAHPEHQMIADATAGVVFCALAAFVLINRQRIPDWRVRAPLLLAVTGYLALFAIFSVVAIWDNLWGRFLWFVPLLAVPPLSYHVARGPRPMALGVFAVVLVAQAHGLRVHVPRGAIDDQPLTSLAGTRQTPAKIRPGYFLSGRPNAPVPPGCARIDPPTYDWLWRWRPDASREMQETVRVH